MSNTFGETLKRLRKERKMSMEALAEMVGTSKQVISRYENGERSPKISMVKKLADALGVSIMEISGEDPESKLSYRPDLFPQSVIKPLSSMHHQKIPLIGSVAAGHPIMDAEYDTFLDAPIDCDAAVKVTGDSMEPTYYDGDILYIKQQPDVNNGQIAVVFIDDAAVVKHVYHESNGVTLTSDNTAYPPMRFRFSEDAEYISIFGIPVGYTRMYKQKPLIHKGF